MQNLIVEIISEIEKVVKGKDTQVKLALACLLANGHLLIEDLPGMGKTTLASVFAKVLGLQFSRVQFTSDMLPADILGSSVYEKESGLFRFHKGPIFTQLLLADEINRTTPKTQSALLEAMAEGQVTIDGTSYTLDKPFFVIATQNPSSQFGTFLLPESQLDRFLMRVQIGYPDPASERAMLEGKAGRGWLASMSEKLTQDQLLAMQLEVASMVVSPSLLDYLQRLIEFTRSHEKLHYGLSPRAALGLLVAAKAWAYIHQRQYVIPEDVQAVLMAVAYHRLVLAADSPSTAYAVLESMLNDVSVS